MERHFDEQLNALKTQLLHMGSLAEAMIHGATEALVDRNAASLSSIQAQEEEVDRMQLEIDEACLTLIALHQPAAGDLRFILGVAKANTDLERLADQAVNISHKALRLMADPSLALPAQISRMAGIARSMLHDSLHAYVTCNTDAARDVILHDKELNALKGTVSRELTDHMKRDASVIDRALDVALVARNIERIGDHAKNIAEHAIFVVEGRDIRHGTPHVG